ncbi:MAG: permease-like cell division protein FtsX [Patescibacteria group bacterium]|jgi:cell division transport system permease protein
MFLSLIRVIKFSLQDIYRNIWLSIVTITILILALFSVNMLLTVEVISRAAIDSVKEKIDINLYLKSDSKKEEILAVQSKVSNLEEVKAVRYISKEEAMEKFNEKHKGDPEILEALKELNDNPLTPTLVIQAKDIDQYGALISKINEIDSPAIESRNFNDHKMILKKIDAITKKVSEAGAIISLIFVLITALLVYNSIRVAIYIHRREIGIMRLVGASSSFIKMPYLFSSVIYTFVGLLVVIVIFFPFLGLLQPYLEAFFIDYNIDIISYFSDNFLRIFGLQFLALAAVNAVASLIAVSKYSKV